VDKRQFILQAIKTVEQTIDSLPESLNSKFNSIKQQLSSMSDEEMELQTNMVVSSTEGESYNPEHPIALLEESYSELEEIAKQTHNHQLLSVLNQFRGFLDIPERYFP
jgi:uncharacterized protein (DUF2344 family)